MAIDPSNSQILDYKRTENVAGMVPVPTSVFDTTQCVDIRADLVDADIYIFSPVVWLFMHIAHYELGLVLLSFHSLNLIELMEKYRVYPCS